MDRRITNGQPGQPSINVQHAFQAIAADTVNNSAGIKFEYSHTNVETEPGGSKTSQFISGNHIEIEGSVNYNTNYVNESNISAITQWLSSLSSPWYPAIQREIVQIASKTNQAGQWLLSDTRFLQWKNGTSQRLLCSGIPGAGKTVLTSIAIRELQSTSKHGHSACVYIYFNHRESERENLKKIVISLLAQLVRLQGNRCEPSRELKDVYEGFRLKGMPPTLSESIDVLEAELKVFDRVYLVVDAIDECSDGAPHSNRDGLLQFIQNLPSNVSTLLTSRPDEGIRKKINAHYEIPIRANTDDLKSYIGTRFDSRGSTSALIRSTALETERDYKEFAIDRVIEKSDGMFLLAQLHVDHLCQQLTRADFAQALETFPATLPQVYATSLERIRNQDDRKYEIARKALGWLVFAKTSLTIGQLLHCVAIKPGITEIHDLTTTEDTLTASCAGLIVVDSGNAKSTPESRIARLAHYTVETFYMETLHLHQPAFQSDIVHACLTYLSLHAFENDLKTDLSDYPFLKYAADHWGQHFQAGVKGDVYKLAAKFLTTPKKLQNALRAMTDERFTREKEIGPMHMAAYFGISKLCRQLHTNRALPLNTATARRETALHWAAIYCQNDALQSLVQLGADVDFTDKTGASPLLRTVMNGNKRAVEYLVSFAKGINVDTMDERGWSPLRWAAAYGMERIAHLLLAHGAEIDGTDKDGWTALRWAAQRGYRKMVDLLLEKNATIYCRDGWTLLHWAASEGRLSMVQVCLDKRIVQPSVRNAAGESALMLAVKYGHSKIAWQLLQHGAEIDMPDKHGLTALHVAAGLGQKSQPAGSLLWLLLESGANVQLRNENGMTALDVAARAGKLSTCWLLLHKGSTVTNRDNSGHTVLHQVLEGNADTESVLAIVELLTLKGVDVQVTNKQGLTAVHVAALKGRTDVLKYLEACGANMMLATIAEDTALHLAIQSAHTDVVDTLIRIEPRLLVARNSDRWTPLHLAASLNHVTIVSLLLSHSCDINARDWNHNTPLHLAAKERHAEAVDLLLQAGANPNIPNKGKATALHAAAASGSIELIDLLISHGADSSMRDGEGMIAWEAAKSWGHNMEPF